MGALIVSKRYIPKTFQRGVVSQLSSIGLCLTVKYHLFFRMFSFSELPISSSEVQMILSRALFGRVVNRSRRHFRQYVISFDRLLLSRKRRIGNLFDGLIRCHATDFDCIGSLWLGNLRGPSLSRYGLRMKLGITH